MESLEPVVSVVVPSYRGGARLGALLDVLDPVLADYASEIVVVDDASPDRSWAEIEALVSRGRIDGAVRFHRRSGQQAATLAGCMIARGKCVVTLDDDLEHDPARIPDLLRLGKRYDLVYAVPCHRTYSSLRRYGSHLFDLVFRVMIGKPRGVRLTSYRLMTRSLISCMLGQRVRRIYVSALALRCSPRVATVSVAPGPPSRTRQSIRDLIRVLLATVLSYGHLGRAWYGLKSAPLVAVLLPDGTALGGAS